MGEKRLVPEQVTISAPSRLHLGLFSIGNLVPNQFGGIGLMIESPRTEVTVQRAARFQVVDGPGSQACRSAIEGWFQSTCKSGTELGCTALAELPVNVQITKLPPRHSGFGTGTQLAFASALALSRFFNLPIPSPEELAMQVDRGKRSAIGSYGFFRGGILVDRGKSDPHHLAPLDFQTDFPEPWRIVTVMIKGESGIFGRQEVDAFEKLPGTSRQQQQEMIEIVRDRIIPGLLSGDFEEFSTSLYQFGRKSGMMYAEIQNGPYNGPQIASLIQRIRDLGFQGVGQSSWGPCVYAITRDQTSAHELTDDLKCHYGDRCDIQVSKADNQGARTVIHESSHEIPTNE